MGCTHMSCEKLTEIERKRMNVFGIMKRWPTKPEKFYREYHTLHGVKIVLVQKTICYHNFLKISFGRFFWPQQWLFELLIRKIKKSATQLDKNTDNRERYL